MRALIGSTGFVGGTLRSQTDFDVGFHSRNIEDIRGGRFDLVVCAGAPAEKWRANREPAADLAGINRLMDCLAQVTTRGFILISTVDVYPDPVGVDEATPISADTGSPYGRHRYLLERFVRERFRGMIVRLPGLFGTGLKKNLIYDLLHHRPTTSVAPASVFQYYDLERLWLDIERAKSSDLGLVNFATEGIPAAELAREVFGVELEQTHEAVPVRYDMRTRHAALFGGGRGYLEGRGQVLDRLRTFVNREGWSRP